MTTIRAIPVTYSGVRFRSTLEADWAHNLDLHSIVWQYEPEAIELPSGTQYRPDFYLPEIATWLEVKGNHDERIEKVHELAAALEDWWSESQVVIVGRPPTYGLMTWEYLGACAPGAQFNCCRNCLHWWWMGSGSYGCRRCDRGGAGDHHIIPGGNRPFVQLQYRQPLFAAK